MFSSNQILDISCDYQELDKALEFAIGLYGDEIFKRKDGRVKIAFCDSVPGVYLVGTGSMQPYKKGVNVGWFHDAGKGWVDFPFDYDPKILAGIIIQWAEKQKIDDHSMTDGSRERCVRIRSLQSAEKYWETVKDVCQALDTILVITPFEHVYDK